jgi:diguanylate cyclase (GGDEF)-like protein
VSASRASLPRSDARAWLITGPLAATVVLFTVVAQMGQPIPAWDIPLALAFVVAIAAASIMVVRLEVRRQTNLVTPADIPLLLGLYYLPPLLLVIAVVLATIVVYRRQSRVKLWFNVASIAAGAGLASVIVRAGLPLDGTSPQTWLLLAGAVFAHELVTKCAVTGVITLVQGTIDTQELVRSFVISAFVVGANITIGLVVLVALQVNPWVILLLAGLAAVFVVAYRSYANSLQQSRTLTEMYWLTRAAADAPHDRTLPDVLLGRVRQMLQAEYATLWVPGRGRHPEVLLSAKVDYDALLDVAAAPMWLRRRAFDSCQTVAIGPRLGGSQLRAELAWDGTKDVIIAPLRAGSAVIGCLEVVNRLGDTAHFGPSEVRLLETIAGHAAVAVENSRLVERLRFDAYHDALTGLPNRRRVSDSLEDAVAARTSDEVVAVLLLDVNGLREANEALGRAAGDQLLLEVAARLREVAPPAALVGRVGGDSYAVTVRLPDAGAAVELAATIREQLRRPLEVGSIIMEVDVAVGVALHPEHGTDPAMLLQRADVATHAAKGLASGVQLFNDALESRSARRLGIAADLRQALDRGELEVYFQPKVAIGDRALVGVECLARWEHPAHGAVAPEDFVAVAEHTGLLAQLTDAVLAAGLTRARHWADGGHPLPVAVNLSARTLLDPGFPPRVAQLLAEHEVPPHLLTLEITEDAAVGGGGEWLRRPGGGPAGGPLPALYRLSELGVRLAVDDFGTGYSSLSLLRQLPVQEVKVDKMFVQGMATDAGDLAIVRTVVDLARHFGLVVVAEGVESELTLNLLQEIGCDVGQGFLFSRPLPYERLEAWVAAQTETAPSPAGQVRRLRAVG